MLHHLRKYMCMYIIRKSAYDTDRSVAANIYTMHIVPATIIYL